MTFFGNTATAATSTPVNIPTVIESFSIANKTGGAITVSVGFVYGSSVTYILYNKSVNSGDSYIYSGEAITVEAEYSVYVSVSGSADYYFSINAL